MNMKNIPESKKLELLKALQAVVGKIEEIEEEAKATQEAPEEHKMPAELEAAIKVLHELAVKHGKTFVMAMEVFDDAGASGQVLSCYGLVGKQLDLVCAIIEQIAAACDKSAVEILKDLTALMLMREMFDKEEDT
ncbi:MAG: hypothetical protein IKN55_11260 [Oscillospiraceae bacterium]|nr:hypothetical protein [Oscillospiraceae bacterium]